MSVSVEETKERHDQATRAVDSVVCEAMRQEREVLVLLNKLYASIREGLWKEDAQWADLTASVMIHGENLTKARQPLHPRPVLRIAMALDVAPSVHAGAADTFYHRHERLLGPHVLAAVLEGPLSVGLVELLRYTCPNLRVLDLSQAPGLTLRALDNLAFWPQLHDLRLNLFLSQARLSYSEALTDTER